LSVKARKLLESWTLRAYVSSRATIDSLIGNEISHAREYRKLRLDIPSYVLSEEYIPPVYPAIYGSLSSPGDSPSLACSAANEMTKRVSSEEKASRALD
jgi:hypothetical protein